MVLVAVLIIAATAIIAVIFIAGSYALLASRGWDSDSSDPVSDGSKEPVQICSSGAAEEQRRKPLRRGFFSLPFMRRVFKFPTQRRRHPRPDRDM